MFSPAVGFFRGLVLRGSRNLEAAYNFTRDARTQAAAGPINFMSQENARIAKELFEMVNLKIQLLRVEMDLLEAEGNGLRSVAENLVKKLGDNPLFSEPNLINENANSIHQKWAEQAQRYNLSAGTIARIFLDKSRQAADLVHYLRARLNELGYELPNDESDFPDWDDIIFESDEAECA